MQQCLAMRREFDEDFSLVLATVPATNCAAFDQAIYQLDSAVMAEAKLLRKRCDCWTAAFGQTLDGQENLMLLRLDSLGAGSLFAKVQKLPDTVTELGEAPKAKFRYIRSSGIGEVGILTVSHRRKPF